MTRDEEWLLKEKWGGEKTEGFFADSKRLTDGEPLAYVIGHIPFLNTTIHLDLPTGQTGSRPLIPRTETEFWIEKAITDMKSRFDKTPVRVLDLCAGSGCIGVAVLKEISMAHVDFVEIDVSHHQTIEKNIHANNISLSRAHIFGGNLFEHIHDVYDVILTNPPYIDKHLDRTDTHVIAYEPSLALFGGVGGMELISIIIQESKKHLTQEGVLYIEHEPEQVAKIHTLAHAHGFTPRTYPDQFKIERYTVLTRTRNSTVQQ